MGRIVMLIQGKLSIKYFFIEEKIIHDDFVQ